MSRLLILPDLHQDTQAGDAMVRRGLDEGADRFIFLGDLFDSLNGPEPESAVRAARWLLDWRERLGERLIVLFGNHDLPYAEASGFIERNGPLPSDYKPLHNCSGFTAEKAEAIQAAVGSHFWDFWRLHHREDGVLFTHAGADAAQEATIDAEAPLTIEGLRSGNSGRIGLLAVGESRGGLRGGAPGICWRDLSEFADEAPVFQIFGHSRQDRVVRFTPRALCLDAGAHAYAILDAGTELRLLSTRDLELKVRFMPFDERYAEASRRHGRSILRKTSGPSSVIGRGQDLSFRLQPQGKPPVSC